MPAHIWLCSKMDVWTESCMRMVDLWMDARQRNKWWILENKRLKWVYLLSQKSTAGFCGLQPHMVALWKNIGFTYFLITWVCGTCSVEQLPSSMLSRWLPWGFSSQGSEAQCKAYFSLGNTGHLTIELRNSLQVKNQCTALVFFCIPLHSCYQQAEAV